MSIGSETPQGEMKFQVAAQASYLAKKATAIFFADPLSYTFYLMLAATIIGLFVGKTFSLPYYFILTWLCVSNIYVFFYGDEHKGMLKDK